MKNNIFLTFSLALYRERAGVRVSVLFCCLLMSMNGETKF